MGTLGRQAAGWLAFFGSFLGGTGFKQRSYHPAEITAQKQITFCFAFLALISKMAQSCTSASRKVDGSTCLPKVG